MCTNCIFYNHYYSYIQIGYFYGSTKLKCLILMCTNWIFYNHYYSCVQTRACLWFNEIKMSHTAVIKWFNVSGKIKNRFQRTTRVTC